MLLSDGYGQLRSGLIEDRAIGELRPGNPRAGGRIAALLGTARRCGMGAGNGPCGRDGLRRVYRSIHPKRRLDKRIGDNSGIGVCALHEVVELLS